MVRYSLILAALTALFVLAQGADAQISRNNPYRSFNLTGVNYGSMQWEAKHKRQSTKSWSSGRTHRRFFRGR